MIFVTNVKARRKDRRWTVRLFYGSASCQATHEDFKKAYNIAFAALSKKVEEAAK